MFDCCCCCIIIRVCDERCDVIVLFVFFVLSVFVFILCWCVVGA